jgi:SSS family solute:Na+ symporter
VGLQILDWILIGLYASTTIAIGWYFGRKQTTTKDYFIGSGNMNPALVGISLFATLLSTISYLSMPGEIVGKGPMTLAGLACYPLVYLVVAYGLLPVYMRHRVTSAYELLELKLGISVRLLGATMFLLLRLVWMSLLVYLAAKAMSVMMGVGEEWIPLIVLFTGFVAVVYTSIGGLRAVVVTDALQTALLFGGALLVIATVTYDFGGFGWFPTQWQSNWDTQPIVSFDPRTRVTVLGTVLSVMVWYTCTAGGDQTSVQRFMATRDVGAARWASAIQLMVGSAVGITLGLVGMALLGYFKAHPQELPPGMSIAANADQVFPRFIAYHLPVGVSGLVVSAMFAAAMSSIDSGVNSITAVVSTDYLDRFGLRAKTERGHLLFARVLAFSIGAVVVFGSTFMGWIPGNITAVTNKTVNLLTAPIFGLFFFALFVPFARPAGVWAGTICGTIVAGMIAFSGPLVTLLDLKFGIPVETFGVELHTTIDAATGAKQVMANDPVSFQWISPAGLLVDLVIGLLVSWLIVQQRNRSAKGLTS